MAEINRTGAEALIPEDYSSTIVKEMETESAFLAMAKRLPDMSTQQRRMPVLSALPLAYFNNAGSDANDTSYKQTTKVDWEDKFINAEEISCIVPIAENVLEDTNRNLWSEIQPLIREAIGVVIDGATIFGTNAPNAWPEDLFDGATAASNTVALGANGDLYDDLLGEGGLISFLEADGYFPNGHVAAMLMRAKLRGVRYDQGGGAGTGEPIFMTDPQQRGSYLLDGQQIIFSKNGAFDTDKASLLSADWSKIVYAVRKDITYKMLDQAVIQDPADGSIVYNLAQQDMVALRVTFRMGWQVPNPVNRLQATEADRYPAAFLTPAAPAG